MPKWILSCLLLLLLTSLLEGQIMLNEVYVNPPGGNGSPPQSIDEGDEWVELFNGSCDDMDVGGWYVATQVLAASGVEEGGGVIELAAGTIVPALGTLAIGRTHTMGTVICRIPKFVLANEQGWVGVYDADGNPVDAIFWSFNSGNIESPRYSLNPCNGTGPINLPTATQFNSAGKMRYVGIDPNPGTIFRRMPDGKDWQSIVGGASPNQCNTGACESVPASKIIAPKFELCSGEFLELNAESPDPRWSYTWTSGTTANGFKTGVLFTNNTNLEINREVKLSVKTPSGFCDNRDSIELTIFPMKRITKINGPSRGCALNFSDYNADLMDADNYKWSVEGGNIVNGQGSVDITVSWGNNTNIGRVCVEASGQCVSAAPICMSVDLIPKRNLDSIAGEKKVCETTVMEYVIPNLYGATAYNWTATNGAIQGPKNMQLAKVKWLGGGGKLCATIQSDCADPDPYCIDITAMDSLKAQPIIGDSIGCKDDVKRYSSVLSSSIVITKWITPDTLFTFSGLHPDMDIQLSKSGNIGLQVFGECVDTLIQLKQIEVINKPTVSYILEGKLCAGDTITYKFSSNESIFVQHFSSNGQIIAANDSVIKTTYQFPTNDTIKIAFGRKVGINLPCDIDSLQIPISISQCNICDDFTKATFSYPDTLFCHVAQPMFPTASNSSAIGKLSSPSLGNLLDSITGQLIPSNAPSGYHIIYNIYTPMNPLCPIVLDSYQIRIVNDTLRVGYNPVSCDGITPIELSGADTFFMGSVQTASNFLLHYTKDTTVVFQGKISTCASTLSIDLKKDSPIEKRGRQTLSLCTDSSLGISEIDLDSYLSIIDISGGIIDLNTNTAYQKNKVHVDSFSGSELILGVIRLSKNTCPDDTAIFVFRKTNCNPCNTVLPSVGFRYDSLYCNPASTAQPIMTSTNSIRNFTSTDLPNLQIDGSINLAGIPSGRYKIYNTYTDPKPQCPHAIDSFTINIIRLQPTISYDSIVCKGTLVNIELNGAESYSIANQAINATFQLLATKDTSLVIQSQKSNCSVSNTVDIKTSNCAADTCISQDTIVDLRILEFGKCVNDTVVISAVGKLNAGGIFSYMGSPELKKIDEVNDRLSFIVNAAGLYKVVYTTNDPDGSGPCRSVMDTLDFNIFATPVKPKVTDYKICTNTQILSKQGQLITWQNLSTRIPFVNDTLRNLPHGKNNYAASININGCTSDTSQFIVEVHDIPARIFGQDTFMATRCFDERDSIVFDIDENLYTLNFTSNVTKGGNNQYYFQNKGKLQWKLIEKASGCVRNDSLLFRPKQLNPIILEVKDPLCSGQNNGIITLKGLVQPFEKNKLYLNKIEIPFQQSIDSLAIGKYSLMISHPDFCDVEKVVELSNPNALKSMLLSSAKGELDLGSNLVLLLDIVGGTPPYAFHWQSINKLDCDTCRQVLVAVNQEEALSVNIKDALGCDTSLVFQLEIEDNGILFPNIINANSENENAVFNPQKYLIESIHLKKVSIYDRWGNTVYYGTNLPKDWEGVSFKNYDLLPGVYLYMLEISDNGKVDRIFGDFLLMK